MYKRHWSPTGKFSSTGTSRAGSYRDVYEKETLAPEEVMKNIVDTKSYKNEVIALRKICNASFDP